MSDYDGCSFLNHLLASPDSVRPSIIVMTVSECFQREVFLDIDQLSSLSSLIIPTTPHKITPQSKVVATAISNNLAFKR